MYVIANTSIYIGSVKKVIQLSSLPIRWLQNETEFMTELVSFKGCWYAI